MIPAGEEVGSFIDVDQFVTHLSQETCGFMTVLLNRYAAERGKPYEVSAAVLQSMQKIWYTKFDGPDVAANGNGMTLPQLYTLIVDVGRHYQNLYPDGGITLSNVKHAIPYWIGEGYPVIMAITESSVHDIGLNANPYRWDTTNITHIITITGMSKNGNVLVRDTANVGRQGPREYDLAKLDIIEATVFVPAWLPRPYSAFEVAAPPTTQRVPIPVPVPAPVTIPTPVVVPTPTLAEITTALQQISSGLQKVVGALQKYDGTFKPL